MRSASYPFIDEFYYSLLPFTAYTSWTNVQNSIQIAEANFFCKK